MKKIYLLTAKDKQAAEVKKWFKEKSLSGFAALTDKAAKADLFMVAGGDGTLLHAISLFKRYNKPFFGINRGSRGFLLNQIAGREELEKILKNFYSCNLVKTHLLKGSFKSGGKKKVFYAYNDIYIKASHGNARLVGAVKGEKNFPRQEFDGDGIIISTPQGSTAYNYAAGGAIISLGAKQLAIKSICARKPLRAVVPEQQISVEIIRGQATAYADHGKIISGVRKLKVWPTRESVTLTFKPGYDFEHKRWQEKN